MAKSSPHQERNIKDVWLAGDYSKENISLYSHGSLLLISYTSIQSTTHAGMDGLWTTSPMVDSKLTLSKLMWKNVLCGGER